jgi:hypothetical protein
MADVSWCGSTDKEPAKLPTYIFKSILQVVHAGTVERGIARRHAKVFATDVSLQLKAGFLLLESLIVQKWFS